MPKGSKKSTRRFINPSRERKLYDTREEHSEDQHDDMSEFVETDTRVEIQESGEESETQVGIQESETPAENQESETSTENKESETPTENQVGIQEFGEESETQVEIQESETPTENQESENPAENQESETPTENQESETSTENKESETPTENQESDTSTENKVYTVTVDHTPEDFGITEESFSHSSDSPGDISAMMSLDMILKTATQEMHVVDSSIIKGNNKSSIKMSNQEDPDNKLIPDYELKEEPTEVEVRKEPQVKRSFPFMLGALALGCLGLLFVFMMFGKKKASPSSSGPTIVEVTELEGTKTKASVNNRQSSPRIIFGDLRKNPSLIVAPMVTPKK